MPEASVTGVLAVADAIVALWLMWTVPKARRNREAVVTVAAVLIGCAGLLAVLAAT